MTDILGGFIVLWAIVNFFVRLILALWLVILPVGLIFVAHGTTVRHQNYEACGAQAASAFSHDNMEDMLHPTTTEMRDFLYKLRDGSRRTCMEGRSYEIDSSAACNSLVATLPDCYRRGWVQTIAAQVR